MNNNKNFREKRLRNTKSCIFLQCYQVLKNIVHVPFYTTAMSQCGKRTVRFSDAKPRGCIPAVFAGDARTLTNVKKSLYFLFGF